MKSSSTPSTIRFAIRFAERPSPRRTPRIWKRCFTRFDAEGRTALYDALIAAIDAVEQRSLPRKVVIVMSDGGDNASAAALSDVLDRARRSSVTVYTIGLFDPVDRDANAGVLESLAETTGGRRYLPHSPGPLLQACERIAHEVAADTP
jgi:Mg-chelatase subunit ChlD